MVGPEESCAMEELSPAITVFPGYSRFLFILLKDPIIPWGV
jgi:hypothetical protein